MHQKSTSVPRGNVVAILLEPREAMAMLKNSFAALVDESGGDEAWTPWQERKVVGASDSWLFSKANRKGLSL